MKKITFAITTIFLLLVNLNAYAWALKLDPDATKDHPEKFYCVTESKAEAVYLKNYNVLITGFSKDHGELVINPIDLNKYCFEAYRDPAAPLGVDSALLGPADVKCYLGAVPADRTRCNGEFGNGLTDPCK